MLLNDYDFYKLLYNVIKKGDRISAVKCHNGKIYKFTCKHKYSKKPIQYECSKNELGTIWDIIEHKQFRKISKYRFYGKDTIIRNGYFGGLMSQNLDNIYRWENFTEEERTQYKMYDIDINKAYLSCLFLDLPYGAFMPSNEVDVTLRRSMIKFYHIKLKSEPNTLKIFIPPHPMAEYKNFDFLLQKPNKEMIISEIRYKMLQKIYGIHCYELIEIFVVAKKQYGWLQKFVKDYEKRLAEMKLNNEDKYKIANAKTQALTLIGMFGKKDEKYTFKELIEEDGIFYIQRETSYKQCANYLPMCMYINDIVADRLLKFFEDEKYNLISWHTDGFVAFIDKNIIIENSKELGKLKSEEIINPRFYSTMALFNRPLIIDENGKTFNSNAICCDNGKYYIVKNECINTVNGYMRNETKYPIKIYEVDYSFKYRKEGIFDILYNNKDFQRLKYEKDVFKLDINKQIYKEMIRVWKSSHYLK